MKHNLWLIGSTVALMACLALAALVDFPHSVIFVLLGIGAWIANFFAIDLRSFWNGFDYHQQVQDARQQQGETEKHETD